MRIGFFTECYHPIVNGVVASIDALREGLRREGHDVVFITPRVPYYQDEEAAAVVRLPSLPLPTSTGYRFTLPVSTRTIDARLGAPLDIAHAHSQFITGALAARYARAHGIPLVFTYHTRLEFYAHYVPFERRLVRRALAAWTRAFANRTQAVLAPTGETRRYLASIGVRTAIEVLPSPIDVERFRAGRRRADLRERLGAEPGTLVVLCVGRLAPEKNVELAIAACAAAPPRVRLALVGEGPLQGSLEREVRRLGLGERVRFAGPVAAAEMPDLYASADALLFPSISETQGLVLVEALAAGLPIVAVDTPQTREILGEGARLVAPEAGKVAAALEASTSATSQQSAIQLAYQRFSIEVQAHRLAALYGKLLGANT
ncbi:MAG TPA: glycosyltransferase [Candidatus Binatia bacterium]|nr:glycosyltransferase [Candidatus Binatia bacterium]